MGGDARGRSREADAGVWGPMEQAVCFFCKAGWVALASLELEGAVASTGEMRQASGAAAVSGAPAASGATATAPSCCGACAPAASGATASAYPAPAGCRFGPGISAALGLAAATAEEAPAATDGARFAATSSSLMRQSEQTALAVQPGTAQAQRVLLLPNMHLQLPHAPATRLPVVTVALACMSSVAAT